MVDLQYSLLGANGDEILFDSENYVLTSGMTGFGIPPAEVRIAESAGNGGIFRFSKRGIRDIDLPITVFGNNRAEVEAKLRRLAKLTQDTKGPTKLKALYATQTPLSLSMHYVGGAEGQWGEDENLTYCNWVMSFQAPMPFWESDTTQTFSLGTPVGGRGLLPQLTKLKLSSSNTLGSVIVSSNADVDVYPVWTIQGPITDLNVSNGTLGFSFDGTVADGETIIVDTEAGTVKTPEGVNRYDLLGPAPKLFPFPPGSTTISVTGTGSDSNTLIRCDYALRFEVVH